MGTQAEWTKVFCLALFWAIGMLLWGAIQRRRTHRPSLRKLPLRVRLGAYVAVALVSLDFGMLTTFWLRAFHRGLLLVLLGTNIALAVVIVAFRLLRPIETT